MMGAVSMWKRRAAVTMASVCVSIEERVRIVGGSVEVVSAPHRGTTVPVHCPIMADVADIVDVV